jgi:hypothetical protein
VHPIHRLVALLAVGVFGVAVLQMTDIQPKVTTTRAAATASAGAATYRAGETPPVHPVVQGERTVVHVAKRPERAAVRRHVVRHHVAAVTKHKRLQARPFLPQGTGMWICQWHRTSGGRAAAIVRRAKWAGLSSLYLRTGSSWDGFTGEHSVPSLLRATRGTKISVVAWDFPRLRRPGQDALRLAHAAWVDRSAKGPHVAAVAPDIETPAEGTFNAAWRVRTYLRVLRQHLPKGVTILTAVPWPSSYRLGDYPYRAVAARSDALVPMAYWYNNSPGYVTDRSIRYLRQFHKPVAPVGQGYDGKLDVPSLPHNNLSRQVPVFFRTAARAGASAVSIWSWQSAKPATWNALARAHKLFAK